MASIHQKPGSPFLYCAYTDADGKRAFKSTKQKNASDAWRVAHAYEDAAKAARRGQITEAQMRKVIASTIAAISAEEIIFHSTRAWFESWSKDMQVSRSKGTGIRYAGIVREFLFFLGPKAERDLATLNKVQIQGFRDQGMKEGLSKSATDLRLKTIRTCLQLAVRQEIIPTNPALAVSLIQREDAKENEQDFSSFSKRAFRLDEVRRLRATAPDAEWEGLILVGYYVGGRLKNCARLAFEQIDKDRGVIRYVPVKQKAGKRIVLEVPIHAELLEYFSSRLHQTGFVFPRLAQLSIEGESGLSRTFRRIIDAAGISYASKAPIGEKGRTVHELGFHSLRRTFNSVLANAGVSQEIRQRLVGHASQEVNDGYTHLEIETFRRAISQLPSLEQRI